MRSTRVGSSLVALVTALGLAIAVFGIIGQRERERAMESLARARLAAAHAAYQDSRKRWRGGEIPLDEMIAWSRHVLESERDLNDTNAGRIAVAGSNLGRMKAIDDERTNGWRNPWGCRVLEFESAHDYVMKEARYWVAAERGF